jgi:hypothetical protein
VLGQPNSERPTQVRVRRQRAGFLRPPLESVFRFSFSLWMNADADACDLAAIYQLEAAAVVQHADHIFAMTSSLSCGDLVAIVNLNDAAARQLDCERLEGRLRLHMSNWSIMGLVVQEVS